MLWRLSPIRLFVQKRKRAVLITVCSVHSSSLEPLEYEVIFRRLGPIASLCIIVHHRLKQVLSIIHKRVMCHLGWSGTSGTTFFLPR